MTALREPATLREARDAVTSPGVLRFTGGGTKASWGRRGEADAQVSTRRLDRLLAHNAADATVSVQAGMPLARLQAEVAAAGQWVAVDPVGGPDATVGGIFASDDAGPQRLVHGTLRDLVIGVTVILADGSVGRSGGFVIKNVAGYDLGRLFCGSFGTLGLVAELNLRLHPRPERTASLRAPADAEQAVHAAARVSAAALEPTAVDLHDGELWLRFAGRAAAVDGQLRDARGELQALGLEPRTVEEDREDWERLTVDLGGEPGETVLRIGTLPGDLPAVAAAVVACTAGTGVAARLSSHVATGAHTVHLTGGDPASPADMGTQAGVVSALRDRLAALAPVPGHVVVRRHDPALESHLDVWGPPPPAVALMRQVKERFDPERRCAPGTFVDGI